MLQCFQLGLSKRSPFELEIVLPMYFNGMEAKQVTMLIYDTGKWMRFSSATVRRGG